MTEELAIWLSGSIVLFLIGLYGMISQRDGLKLIISIEIMLIAANSIFIGFGYLGSNGVDPLAQTYTILSLGIGGAIIGFALAIVARIYQQYNTVDVSKIKELKW